MEACRDISKYKAQGPAFADGSINWECPCMGGGTLVAHRCGHHFRKLYKCMKASDENDAMVKCPEQFIDWATCMQNLNEKAREAMKRNLLEENRQKTPSK
ncbi:unnamed protein product, partial [Mesorhabditis belari]|uniref:CHCH domain-containing protein n=1 Tax=Mesorhabditis belari TaxID=2138241 RepID=A0AAF3FNE6_9BILA